MNTIIISGLLQLATSILIGAQNNAAMPPATAALAVSAAGRAIQEAAQLEAMPRFTFPIAKNESSAWANINDLYRTAYLDANGNYVALGNGVGSSAGVALVAEDTSFGDLNADGADDAAVIVNRTVGRDQSNSGQSSMALAAMLNQGGIMFNIADVPLGSAVTIYSHHVIQGGTIVLDMQVGNGPRAIYQYQLLGDQLVSI